jgi:hypothetical protein
MLLSHARAAVALIALLGLSHVAHGYAHEHGAMRKIETAPGQQEWVTQEEVLSLLRKNVRFIDVTEHPEEISLLQGEEQIGESLVMVCWY